MNRDALLDDSIVLHVGHAKHAINLGDTQPVQDIRHQSLEAHILDTGDILRTLEVLARTVFATLSGIVHKILCHFAKGTTFLAEVNDYTAAAALCFFDRLLDAKSKVRAARADVGAKHVTAVALVVDA